MRCLVTAIGSMSAEAVIQSIKRLPGTSVMGCNMHPREWTAAAHLVEHFYQVPPATHSQSYVARLLELCEKERISHVLPLTDVEVDVLSEHRQHFDTRDIVLCISSPSAISIARNKLAMHNFFAMHKRIHPIPTVDLQDPNCISFSFPMLAKPSYGRSSEGIVNISDKMALDFWRSRLRGQDYVIQPRYEGEIFVVDLVRQKDGENACVAVAMTRQELLRTANGAGMTVHMRPGHSCEALALEVAETLGVLGCVNIEFLVTSESELLMDINPRFSAGVAFSMLSGYDMVENHLRCFNGERIESCKPPPDKVYTRRMVEFSLQDS